MFGISAVISTLAVAPRVSPPAIAESAPLVGRWFSADDVLSPYVYVFYAAFIVAFLFTPIMQLIAREYGIIDQPDNLRKMHTKPVAYLGGIAVFLGWLSGLAISQFSQVHGAEPSQTSHLYMNFSIVVGGSIIVILGLWDDLKGVSPWSKIAGQIFAATVLLCFGIGTRCAVPMFQPLNARLIHLIHWQVPETAMIAVSCVIVYVVVVGCCNATNLMDGLDGLSAGVTGVVALGFLFLAINIARFGGSYDVNLDGTRVVLALALLGAVLGFIPYNFNPASIFMGDAGSMFLGFSCATMILLAAQETHPKYFLASIIMFALPILDTTLAFARRWVNGRPLFSPDRHHFHHQVVARGFSVKQTVLISYGLAIFFAVAGGSIAYIRTRYAVGFYLVIFGSIVVAAYKMGMVHEKPRVVDRKPMGSFDSVAPAQPIEPNSVIEIRDLGKPG